MNHHVAPGDKSRYDSHLAGVVMHITAEERARWNTLLNPIPAQNGNDILIETSGGLHFLSGEHFLSMIRNYMAEQLSASSHPTNDSTWFWSDCDFHFKTLRSKTRDQSGGGNGWTANNNPMDDIYHLFSLRRAGADFDVPVRFKTASGTMRDIGGVLTNAVNGRIMMANGLSVQWGSIAIPTNGGSAMATLTTLTTVFQAFATPHNAQAVIDVTNLTTTGITIRSNVACTVRYLVIGFITP